MSIDPKTSVISVVIPTLNAADGLAAALALVVGEPGVEVVLVDGGSRDETVAIAKARGVRVLDSAPGRGRQMNAGAAVTCGDILLFLHGDTVLPAGFAALVRETLARPEVAAGAFRLSFARPTGLALGMVAWGANLRSRWFGRPYGDQALFVRRELFTALGGFPELPIMEDVVLVSNLRRHGRIVTRPEEVVTSARRWQREGVWRHTLRNQLILFGFYLGVAGERLAGWYRRGEKL
ncbi:MAG: TIGR04283 family arsenosugar biosynthesis glycosyltransferase [Desulfobulbaceae bacterium]|nr:TIGR04283 family arsenosugar biosynthesis glycosyltransferase [Desulfobulbaceae bacterium]